MGPPESQTKTGIARWWDVISHHPFWATLIAGLIAGLLVAAIIAHSGGLFSDSTSHAASPATNASPLRATFHPAATRLYAVAFDHDIGLPNASEQWQALHDRGGVDIGASAFHATLANRSAAPLTITNIEAVVRRIRLAPATSLALVYTQGAGALEDFAVALTDEQVGATAPFHQIGSGLTLDPASAPLFFPSHNIALSSGEIYEAKVDVVAQVHRELEYDFTISGNTAGSGFTYHTGSFLIAGHPTITYPHEYWRVPYPGHECWVLATPSAPEEPRCP